MRKDTWTKEHEQYLAENWGNVSIKKLCTKLNRTDVAIRLKAKRLGIGGATTNSEFLTATTVSKILNVDTHTVIDYWIKKCGLKSTYSNMTGDRFMWFIGLDNLIKWLKDNQDKWNSRKVELHALGIEPQWLKDKRKVDIHLPKRTSHKWTLAEDARAIMLFKRGFNYKQIGSQVNRTPDAVEKRLARLDIWGTGKYIGDKCERKRVV